MSFSHFPIWLNSRTRWEKAALIAWTCILLFVSVRVIVTPYAKTVYPIFSASGRLWWSGLGLYEPHRPVEVQNGYRYTPTFAILMTPFALLPDGVGGAAWRLASVAALFAALRWLARTVLPMPRGDGQMTKCQGAAHEVSGPERDAKPLTSCAAPRRVAADAFAWLLLLTIPLALQSVNNGQANVLVIACMVGAVAAVKDERWNAAGLLITLAFVCKVYPLALGMLLIVLYPRQLLVRLPLMLALSLALPFACQHPAYVLEQYSDWFNVLRADDRSWIAVEQAYRDLWLLIRLYVPGLHEQAQPIYRQLYLVLQVFSGAGVAALCWQRQRAGWPTNALLTATLGLAAAWMMLLGPATESSSFVLLAPSLAWSIVEASRSPGQMRRGLLWGSCGLFVAAAGLGGFSGAVKVHALGVHSWASLLYFVYLLAEPRPMALVAASQSSIERRQAA